MKTYYELLGVARDVPADEIKRAFRKEIARYHPDKVQHLGPEFQEIAAVRAAELTEAYRVLMDEETRRRYDEGLSSNGNGTPTAAPRREAAPPPPPPRAPSADPTPEPPPARPPGERRSAERNASTDFVRKVVLTKLREAVGAVSDTSDAASVRGIDAAFAIRGRGGLFRKSEPAVRLLAKFVTQVDADAVAAAWPLAATAGDHGEVVCLLLLGAGLASSRDISLAIAEQRRKARNQAGPVLIPVDVRDWEALFPPDAPASVRSILQRLRAGQV